MYSPDKSNFKKYLTDFYTQIDAGKKLSDSAGVSLNTENIQNIVYLGMGGSAIAGDLLKDTLFKQLHVPMTVHRTYHAPAFANGNSLVVACSYSGNTEEVLSAVDDVTGNGAQVLVISSGGTLSKRAAENGWPLITLPAGYPPRMALGFMFFSLYHTLGRNNLIDDYQEDLSSLGTFVKDETGKHDATRHDGHILALELAKTLHHHIPVLYSSSPFLQTISRRWQNQLHENGKVLAFRNVLPEMNHNEIVGWEMELPCMDNLMAVFLENENPMPRIKMRITHTIEVIKKSGVKLIEVYSSGETVFEKVFSLIVLGDWVSYYLALLNKKDPMHIANIDYLKQQLAQAN